MTSKVTNKEIREWLGHNGYECRVVIGRDGSIKRYGHPDPLNRSKDFWSTIDDVRYVRMDIANWWEICNDRR